MLPIELVSRYIKDIPWENSPFLTNNESPTVYQAVLKTIFDHEPLPQRCVSFEDNVWDFRPYYEHKNRPAFMINFGKLVPSELELYAKYFVIYSILDNNSPTTAKHRLYGLSFVLKNAKEVFDHDSIYLITTDDIISTIDRKDLKPETIHFYFCSAYEIWSFFIETCHLELPVDLNVIHNKALHYSHLAEHHLDSNKLPDIPLKLYNAIINKAVEVMRDKTKEYTERAFCCILIIGSQLGLRLGDLMDLRINNLKSIALPKTNVSANFIHYTAGKPSRGFGPLYEFDMYSSDTCTEAYKTLSELREQHPLADSNDFLYLTYNRIKRNDNPFQEIKKYPVSDAKFNDEYERFVFKYLKDICTQPWPGIAPRKFAFLRGTKLTKDEYKQTQFYIPEIRQYRVRVCTGLYMRGVPLSYIKKFMGHLSEEMLGYYVRPKDRYKENLEYTAKVIRTMAGEDSSPIGIYGDSIKHKTKEFIQANNYNVYEDIDKIIEALGNKLVIRAKAGGVCIKTSLIPCADETSTNKLLCTYNLCPNVYQFFWMVDVAYLDFKTAISSYESTMENGFAVEATKQRNIIKDIISRRLEPELSALHEAVQKEGLKTIMENYPSLIPILDTINDIKKEIQQWR